MQKILSPDVRPKEKEPYGYHHKDTYAGKSPKKVSTSIGDGRELPKNLDVKGKTPLLPKRWSKTMEEPEQWDQEKEEVVSGRNGVNPSEKGRRILTIL